LVKYKLEKDDGGDVPSYKGLNNTCIRSDWDEIAEDTNTGDGLDYFLKRKERLKSSNVTRRFGQQLYPMFFKDSRAITANTNVVRKRQQSQHSQPFVGNRKSRTQMLYLSEADIKGKQHGLTSFKENIGNINIVI
jgi:hypothetical protein